MIYRPVLGGHPSQLVLIGVDLAQRGQKPFRTVGKPGFLLRLPDVKTNKQWLPMVSEWGERNPSIHRMGSHTANTQKLLVSFSVPSKHQKGLPQKATTGSSNGVPSKKTPFPPKIKAVPPKKEAFPPKNHRSLRNIQQGLATRRNFCHVGDFGSRPPPC